MVSIDEFIVVEAQQPKTQIALSKTKCEILQVDDFSTRLRKTS